METSPAYCLYNCRHSISGVRHGKITTESAPSDLVQSSEVPLGLYPGKKKKGVDISVAAAAVTNGGGRHGNQNVKGERTHDKTIKLGLNGYMEINDVLVERKRRGHMRSKEMKKKWYAMWEFFFKYFF